MKNKTSSTKAAIATPQIQVRTGMRSGDAVAKCQRELDRLENRYQQLSTQARQRGIAV